MIIEEFFNSRSIPTIVKWIVTILVTGFIAQFGKKFADFLIAKKKKRKSGEAKIERGHSELPDRNKEKIEKKTLKAEIKRSKKTSKK